MQADEPRRFGQRRVLWQLWLLPSFTRRHGAPMELPQAFPEMKWAWLLLDPEDMIHPRRAAALAGSFAGSIPACTHVRRPPHRPTPGPT
jgi:hypothetical protein